MNKVKTIKVKNEDGSISEESYSIAADALNIDMVNGKNVQETIGTIDVDKDGDIAAQLNKKINKSDIIDNLDSSDNNKVLSAKQGKVLNEAVAAANLDIKKKIYYFNTVANMKAANLQAGDVVQTLGYYEENDGGAGLYKIVNVVDNDSIDEKFIIKLSNNKLEAELLYNNELIINQIGARMNDNTFDNYEYFESVKNHKVSTIKFLKGTYYFSRLIMNNGINIKGEGILNTTIKALPSSYSNFISLNYGPVAYLKIEQLKIEGNSSNIKQDGLYFYGLPAQSGTAHGGLWYTIFENIYVSNFTKNQIYFEGYDPQKKALVVNQFCTFNNVYAYGNTNAEDVIKIIHQQGQFEFNNCEFDKAAENYYNIYIDKGDCLFNQLTCQGADNGIYLSGSNVVINNVWFEGIKKQLINQIDNTTTYGGTTQINGGTIRNCCNTENTYGFSSTNRTILNLRNLSFRNSCTYMLFNNSNGNNDILDYENCFFTDTIQTYYKNGYYLGSDTNGILNINTNKTIRLSPTQNITDITFGDKVKDIQEFNIYAHNAINFEGSKFINPKTIAKNSICKIIRMNITMGNSNEKLYIVN